MHTLPIYVTSKYDTDIIKMVSKNIAFLFEKRSSQIIVLLSLLTVTILYQMRKVLLFCVLLADTDGNETFKIP